ncbi:hypothetical protein [Rhizobium mongolense]|uniref:hypothetical protein n=1 Tax=Rhizobium mongolense TaxID=57676 RepID=UPI0034A0F30F
MDVTTNLDKMTPGEKYGAIRLLSRRLHFSAILAKQRGDDFWDRLERLADRLLRESDAIVRGDRASPIPSWSRQRTCSLGSTTRQHRDGSFA